MNKNTISTKKLSFYNIPIRKKLPFFITLLLISVIIVFSYTSYINVRQTALEAGKERLMGIVNPFSSLFSQSTYSFINSVMNVASSQPVTEYLLSKGRKGSLETANALNRLSSNVDTLALMVELRNAKKERVLIAPDMKKLIEPDSEFINKNLVSGIPSASKLYKLNNNVYWAAVAPVMENKQTIGYLIKWRLVLAPKKVSRDLSNLLGTNALLFLGNQDEDLWYNLNSIVPAPPIDVKNISDIVEYSRVDGNPVLAAAQKIPGTKWIILIELSKNAILKSSEIHLSSLIIIGVILIAGGFILAFFMSRSITVPLSKLKKASSNIASGDYSSFVDVRQKDELGDLANAFNLMMAQVNNSKNSLESSLTEKEVLLKEIHHRVKNNLQVISSLLSLQTSLLKDSGAIQAIQSSQNRIRSMAIVHEKLYCTENFVQINFDDYMDELIKNLSNSYQVNPGDISFRIELEKICLNIDQAIYVGLIVTELVSNAIKHAFENQGQDTENEISMTGKLLDKNNYQLCIKDNGKGFFKNYDEVDSHTLGLKLVNILVTQIDGRMEMKNKVGSQFDIYFLIHDGKNLTRLDKDFII